MNKRKDILDYLKESLKNQTFENTEDYKYIHDFFMMMAEYYQYKDLEKNTDYGNIFSLLYLNEKIMLYDTIAYETYISLATLNRYRQKYNRFAQNILLLDKKENILAKIRN